MVVLDGDDKFVWNLSYRGVRRFVIDYPSEDPMFYFEGQGFGDWGYHELTDAGDGYLRHEILFATGSTILLESKTVAAERELARPGP